MIQYLWRDTVRPATSVLPPQHWAYDSNLQPYPHDPQKARELLKQAGYSDQPGKRLHLVMKTSTEETSRLLAVILQQQLRKVGVDLELRTFEFATFYSDVVKGAFQIYTLRWVGGANQDPEIFEYIFDTQSFAPRRANRSYYSSPQVDAWIEQGRSELDQSKRKQIYARVQQQTLHDLPTLNLWYFDNVLVHGNSQSGQMARLFLDLGFNEDEHHRQVVDGLWTHIATVRIDINTRFAQPIRAASLMLQSVSSSRLRMASVSRISTAARTARRASSSCARGSPNTAITASPMNFSTVPPWRSTTTLISSK